MAQNVFDATFDANNRIDVNSFDWSHVNNLTTDFGRITPVFCELVPAKGSLRINPEFCKDYNKEFYQSYEQGEDTLQDK